MADDDIAREIRELRKSIDTLNNQRFMRMHATWWRFIFTSFIRGLFVGLGSVIGATVLLYFFIQFLSNIDFIPIVGEWAREIVDIIGQNGNGTPSRFRGGEY